MQREDRNGDHKMNRMIGIRLADYQHVLLNREIRKHGGSMQRFIRYLIDDYFQKRDKQAFHNHQMEIHRRKGGAANG